MGPGSCSPWAGGSLPYLLAWAGLLCKKQCEKMLTKSKQSTCGDRAITGAPGELWQSFPAPSFCPMTTAGMGDTVTWLEKHDLIRISSHQDVAWLGQRNLGHHLPVAAQLCLQSPVLEVHTTADICL